MNSRLIVYTQVNMTQAQIDNQMQCDLDDHLEQCGEWGR